MPTTATNDDTGVSSSLTNAAYDSQFVLMDDLDSTKQLQFQCSGITTATTRTLTAPDANTTIVGTDATQTLTNKTLTSPTITGATLTTATISSGTLASAVVVSMGSGSGTATPSAAPTVSTTASATIANTTETDLWTYPFPANSLATNNKGIKISAFGSYGATGTNKTLKMYFGSTVILNTGAQAGNAVAWTLHATVIRTGASAQLVSSDFTITGISQEFTFVPSTAAEDLTTVLTIKVTGQNGTAAANDILFKGAFVETFG